jgi:hypothetical protein
VPNLPEPSLATGDYIIGGIWSEQWPLGNSQYWSSSSHVARRSRLLREVGEVAVVAVVAAQVLATPQAVVLARVPVRARDLPVDRLLRSGALVLP